VGWTWSYSAGDYIRSKPVVDGYTVYIGSDDNQVHAIGIYSGAILWQFQTDDNVTALAVDDTSVYFGSWDGSIYALDKWGKLRWQYQTDGWVSAAPVLQQGVLYVGSHDGSFYALSTAEGELLWQYKTNGPIEADAAVAGARVVFGSTDGYLHALEIESGERVWYFHTGAAIVAPPVIVDEQLYFGSLDHTFYVLDSTNGQLRWSFTAQGAFASTPAVADGMVFVAADDKQIYALDADDGRLVWQQTTGELIRSSLTVWDELVFLATDNGNLYAFDRNFGTQLWRYRLGGMITAGPTIAGDKLYVGSTAGQLQAIVLDNGESSLVHGTMALEPSLDRVEPLQSTMPDVGLAKQLPQMEEYIRLWTAQAAMPSIDAIRTLQDVIAFRPHSPAAYEAHLTLARYYAQHSEPAAEQAYRAALALEDTAALRLELARHLESQGNLEDAYAEYRLLLRDRPDAFAGMRRTGLDPLTIAGDLNDASFYSDALETLTGIEDASAWTLRGQALLGLGRYEESFTAYQAAVEANPNDSSARFGLALALAWLGRAEEALEEYKKVDTPQSRQNQAQLLAAEEPEQALALYLESPYPNAWWSATALLESQGRLTETLPLYARLAATETQYADDAAYRLYVLGQRLGDVETQVLGQRLLADLGLNWLALRSTDEDLSLPVSAPIDLDETLFAKVEVLEAIGRSDLAYRELMGAARFSATREVDLAIAQALSARGKVLEAQQIAEQYIRQHESAPAAFWELSYPRPYSETVMAAADEFDVDPLLIWAVMREESRFDADALSHANARGLMQVIPLTQEWIAEELELTLAPGDAYVPETSIRMGAWLLSFLISYFEGDVELAIPAYNAGAGSVEYWQADPLVTNRDDLLRWIGYNETRLYLKRVALSYEIYRALYEAK
jgi:soluble lytic murein transglycosylase